MEDPAIPGYVQLRWIWGHWILASRLHGRRQPVGRPGDQWWARQHSRRVCHEKKKEVRRSICNAQKKHSHYTWQPPLNKYVFNCFLKLWILLMSRSGAGRLFQTSHGKTPVTKLGPGPRYNTCPCISGSSWSKDVNAEHKAVETWQKLVSALLRLSLQKLLSVKVSLSSRNSYRCRLQCCFVFCSLFCMTVPLRKHFFLLCVWALDVLFLKKTALCALCSLWNLSAKSNKLAYLDIKHNRSSCNTVFRQ